MLIFVARQPILNRNQKLYGYELLYRMKDEASFHAFDGDSATLSVIKSTLLVIGIEKICAGKKAFINFTRNLLLDGSAYLLPKEFTVVEILEDVEVDSELIKTCETIKKNGYMLALDDFTLAQGNQNPLVDLVDIIKVDYKQTTLNERKSILKQFQRPGVLFLAEKTESREEYEEAFQLGFTFFQGFFFSKPTVISRKDIPLVKMNYIQLLRELSSNDLETNNLQRILERDPSLTYKLLKYINSSFFSLRYEIRSIEHALALLGHKELRKWASLIVLSRLAKGLPSELVRVSLVRANFCESLAAELGNGDRKTEFYLMGMLSILDVLLSRPLDEIIDEIPVSKGVRDGLGGGKSIYSMVYSLVLCYEKGEWEMVNRLARDLRMNLEILPELYTEAIERADDVLCHVW